MSLTVQSALEVIKKLESRSSALQYAAGVVYYDSVTTAPAESYAGRGECLSALTEEMYKTSVNPEVEEAVYFLSDRASELDETTARKAEILKEDYDRQKKIPMQEMMEYSRLENEAAAVWHEAKEKSDFKSFEPVLKKMVEFAKRFNGYTDPDKHPYDAQLSRFEKGMTREYCDNYFAVIKKSLVPLIGEIGLREQPRADFLDNNVFPIYKQRELSDYIMGLMTIDRRRCSIGETEHPFTIGLNNRDVRITTHYFEDRFESSMYSVVHEGGHALYELGLGDDIQGTCLCDITMGMHESQSRFFENIIGRSEPFCALVLPKLKELFPEQFAGVSPHELYLAVNRATPSLIRTEADELTYSMHIMVRYEIEKALFSGDVTVSELPEMWNRLYKEYLGVDVPDDRRGVLQDSHWSSGQFGYFPSYSIGSAYAAQIFRAMKRDLDVEGLVAAGDLAPVCGWLRERMWKYGARLRSQEVMQRVCGEEFDPTCYTDYLGEKFRGIYNL